jgi:hypothetical protein
MSDWIPAPEIENALLLFLDFPEPQEMQNWTGTGWLAEVRQWPFAVVYIFSNDPERAEDWDMEHPDEAHGLAFAAQTGSSRAEKYHAAFRRIFSRANTRRAILIDGCPGAVRRERIEQLFGQLETTSAVYQETEADAGSATIIGLTRLTPVLFDGIEDDGFSARFTENLKASIGQDSGDV